MGLEARDFFGKIFFGIRKYKILRGLNRGGCRLLLGDPPPPTLHRKTAKSP